MSKKILFLIAFISLLNAADVIEYSESKNGLTHPFFGYKTPIITEDEKEINKKILIPKNLDLLAADELSKLIEDSKKIAISFPTDENMNKYITLQNYATKKSEEFAIKWQQALLKDSSLDLSAEASKSTFARNANIADSNTKREIFWKENIDKIGVVVFLNKEESNVNTAQEKVLYFLNKDYPKLAIRTIFVEEHLTLTKEHGVKVTPDIFLVYKDEDEKALWYRVKTGLTTKDEILDNIDFVNKYFILEGAKR